MRTWKQIGMAVAAYGCMVLILSSCEAGCQKDKVPVKNAAPYLETGSAAQGAVGNVVNLSQGWNAPVQEWWWYTSQGTQIIPYDWFLHLEEAGSTDPVRSNENMVQLRYLPQDPSSLNPDGLPVGFVKDEDPKTGDWFGVNCSACHTGELEYNGTVMRVDGGPTLGDFNALVFALIYPAMQETYSDQAKFERFKSKVGDPDGKLRERLAARIAFLTERGRISTPREGLAGHARLDAVNNIFNAVFSQDLGVGTPPNPDSANAPVAYPAIWDAPQTDLVQWAGFVNNSSPAGAVTRNLGEVLGVYATFNFDEESRDGGYESSARLTQQGWLEAWLTDLWSPIWPESILPAIDQDKAARGRTLYLTYCMPCHAVMDSAMTRSPKREIRAQMWPVHFVETDSANAADFARRAFGNVSTGKLVGRSTDYLLGPPMGDSTLGNNLLVNGVAGIIARQPGQAAVSAVRSAFTRVPKAPAFDPVSYRSRPLNGIWATPPYLHNGSVANMWELMLPTAQRRTSFLIGNRAYDPDSMGYSTAMPADSVASLLDTTIPGNSNAGHEYGVDLTDAEKWDLIEYIKTL